MPALPFCQPSGEFQGRCEVFSASVPHPEHAQPNASSNAITASRCLVIKAKRRMLVDDLIAFFNLRKIPTRQDVGDALVRLNALDLNFGHKLAVVAHEKAARFQHALMFSLCSGHTKLYFGSATKPFPLNPVGISGPAYSGSVRSRSLDLRFWIFPFKTLFSNAIVSRSSLTCFKEASVALIFSIGIPKAFQAASSLRASSRSNSVFFELFRQSRVFLGDVLQPGPLHRPVPWWLWPVAPSYRLNLS